jgi:amino acid transporter
MFKLFRCAPPESLKRIVAALALTTVTAIQAYSSKWAVKLADFFTVAKLIGLFVIIASGIGYVSSGNTENLQDMMADSSDQIPNYALAFLAAYWAYSGIANCVNVVEEIKDPVPRNVVISVTVSQLVIMAV